MRRALHCCPIAVLACGAFLGLSSAQTNDHGAQGSVPDPTTYRLRTYVNRIQIPTLVLGKRAEPVEGLSADAFSIRLDRGQAFHPTRARLEGDDPISLGVLIDAAGSQPELVAQLSDALASLVPDGLHESDSVSIFVADCKMYRTRLNASASAADIRSAVIQALQAVRSPEEMKQGGCEASFHLLDYTDYMVSQMKDLPGRKVALIVSGGHEAGSQTSFSELERLAARYAVAVFGLRDPAERKRDPRTALDPRAGAAHYGEQEDRFELLCASHGGLVLEPAGGLISAELVHLMHLLRTRYVLEFPAPDRGVSGLHGFEVSVGHRGNLLVRSTGASASLPDPNLTSDPNVIPTKASPAVFGPRRPLDTTKR